MKKYSDIINKYTKIVSSARKAKQLYYGMHISILPNIFTSFDTILSLGCNALQIFVSNPRTGKINSKSIDWYQKNNEQIKDLIKKYDLKLFIHSSYILNFAKPIIKNSWKNCYWVNSLLTELKVASLIGALGCVIHVGKRLNMNIDDALDNMYDSISYIISEMAKFKLNSKILLETAAGQGTELLVTDGNIDKIADFYNSFSVKQKNYIKLCVDTCHIFSAGYDIRKKSQVTKFFNEVKKKIGLKYIYLIHLNDSREDFSCRKDRHENLGKGYIGLEGLRYFVKYAKALNIPVILETPDIPSKGNNSKSIKNDLELLAHFA